MIEILIDVKVVASEKEIMRIIFNNINVDNAYVAFLDSISDDGTHPQPNPNRRSATIPIARLFQNDNQILARCTVSLGWPSPRVGAQKMLTGQSSVAHGTEITNCTVAGAWHDNSRNVERLQIQMNSGGMMTGTIYIRPLD